MNINNKANEPTVRDSLIAWCDRVKEFNSPKSVGMHIIVTRKNTTRRVRHKVKTVRAHSKHWMLKGMRPISIGDGI